MEELGLERGAAGGHLQHQHVAVLHGPDDPLSIVILHWAPILPQQSGTDNGKSAEKVDERLCMPRAPLLAARHVPNHMPHAGAGTMQMDPRCKTARLIADTNTGLAS